MAASPEDDPENDPEERQPSLRSRPRRHGERAAGEEDEAEDEGTEEDGDQAEGEEREPSEAERLNYSGREVWRSLRDVWLFLSPHFTSRRRLLALLVGGVLIETAFNVAFPLSLKFLVDSVLEDGARETLIAILAALAVFGIIVSVASIAYEWLNARLCAEVGSEVRHRLFAHLQRVSLSFYGRVHSGQVLSRFSGDMESLDELLMHSVDWGLLPFLELVAAVLLLFYLSPEMALIAMAIFPLTIVGPRIFVPRAIDASYDLRRRIADELAVVSETISAQPVVRAFSLQRIAIGWFRNRNDRVRHSIARVRFLEALVERSITISVLLLHLVVFGVGALLAFEEAISIGTFIAFEAVFWELSYNIAHVTQFIPSVIESSGAVRHMNELLEEPERAADSPEALAAPRLSREIRFENVSFGYAAGERQITDVNLEIPAGSRLAVVGESGSGKSTLLALLMRLYEPDEGRITLDGIELAGVSRHSLREQIAVVFQDNVLFATSIRENIRLGRTDATDAEVEAAAKDAEIHRFIVSLPERYETRVAERGSTLSGGQRQRLAIARALVRNPAILLLDEATSALDSGAEAAIARTLVRVGRGRTTITVTHRLSSVADYDRIVVMHDGRILQQGTHAELVKVEGEYRRLWRSRSGGRGARSKRA